MAARREGVLMASKDVVFRVTRYRPGRDAAPRLQEYRIPYTDDMVVLDGLNYIKDRVDPTLTFRWSCRMGICGSCGANVNGTPRLTCGTYIKDIRRSAVVVEPLPNFPILKDLVVEFDDFLQKLHDVKPYIVRKEERPLSEGEHIQFPEDIEAYHQQSLCINCMLCYSACPVYGASPHFVGPAASALAHRYIRDSRDEGADTRLGILSTKTGIWECTFVGECSVVCPKEVDPAGAIQNLKVLASIRQMWKMLLPKWARR
jgi:fumarate reductase iron-sulfur subunit